MERAVVSIGVKKSGQLPQLQAAVESATLFAQWAREHQKVKASQVKLITDAKSPVSRDRIFDTIEKITRAGNVEQLIVYFSGHGINSGLFEQWLLSRAPDDPGAAVNVKGSEFGARFCGVGHVVFISDACRTAADSIQAQRVVGGDIFPNAKPSGAEKPVDQFFATLVGNPAFEVKTVEESTSRFTAAFTKVLLDALQGKVPGLIETQESAGFIRPRPLKRHLATAVPIFFSSLHLPGGESSLPDARIESDPDAWIATLAASATDAARAGTPGAATAARPPAAIAAVEGAAAQSVGVVIAKGVVLAPRAAVATTAEAPPGAAKAEPPATAKGERGRSTRGGRGERTAREARRRGAASRRDLAGIELPPIGAERRAAAAVDLSLERDAFFELRAALAAPGRKRGALTATLAARRARGAGENRQRYDALVANSRTTFGPEHLDTRCGLKVRGARVASAFSRFAATEVGTSSDVVQVTLDVDRKGANVLVELGDGSAVLAPAYRDFITGLSFDRRGNLEDVWCEPSANTERWREYKEKVDEIRELRAVIAATTALGVFRLSDAEDGAALLGRLRAARTLDPALAVYAAHAWSDRRMRSQIVELQRHLDADLGARIFDVSMLAFTLGKKGGQDGPREMYPCVPMLTQGWALLSPLGIELPGGLGALRGELRSSLWTHFEAGAADRLRNVLRQGKVG